jgi:hypothetical protein
MSARGSSGEEVSESEDESVLAMPNGFGDPEDQPATVLRTVLKTIAENTIASSNETMATTIVERSHFRRGLRLNLSGSISFLYLK